MKRLGLRIATPVLLVSLISACGSNSATSPSASPGSVQVASNGPSAAHPAGTESSAGGGNAVVCFDDTHIAKEVTELGMLDDKYVSHIKKIEMLDLYVAKEPFGPDSRVPPKIAKAKPDEEPSKYAERVIERFDSTNDVLAKMIRDGRERFGNHIHFARNGLKRIHDEDLDENIPEGCALVTMAAQRTAPAKAGNPSENPSPELTVDERLFFHDANSIESRGALLLHEYVYQLWLLSSGETNSHHIRNFLRYLLIEKNPTFTDLDLVSAIKDELKPVVDFAIKNSDDKVSADGLLFTQNQNALKYNLHNASSYFDEIYSEYLGIHPEIQNLIIRANKMLISIHRENGSSIEELIHLIPGFPCESTTTNSAMAECKSVVSAIDSAYEQQMEYLVKKFQEEWDMELANVANIENTTVDSPAFSFFDGMDKKAEKFILNEVRSGALATFAAAPEFWLQTPIYVEGCDIGNEAQGTNNRQRAVPCMSWEDHSVMRTLLGMDVPPAPQEIDPNHANTN